MPVVSTKKYHVYLLANRKNGTIYLGMTGELKHRIKAHKEEKYKKAFSKRYQTKKLVYYEEKIMRFLTIVMMRCCWR